MWIFKKLIKQIKNNKYLLFSFVFPILFVFFFLFLYKIDYKDLFIVDSNAQYFPFFYYLKDVFNGTESLFFSFSKGLGESMLGTFLYYLSSPLNLLLIFVSKNNIALFMQVLILFKISLSSFTMHLLLRKIYKKDDFIISIFSLTYAFMGYTVHYYFNIMWLDLIYLAPLVLIGIHKILEGKSTTFYIFFLFLSMVSNFYIAYMLCIFSVCYFLYQMFVLDISNKKKVFFKFVLASICSALLSSFILIPTISELSLVYRGKKEANFGIMQHCFSFFQSFFYGQKKNFIYYQLPCMYFTIFNLFLFFLYFFNSKISKREKKITLYMMIFFFLSYILPFLNDIWHGFSFTVGLGHRFSFLVTLFMILISAKSFFFLEVKSKKNLLLLSFLLFIIYLVCTFFSNMNIHSVFVFMNLFFLVSYALMFFIFSTYKSYFYKFALLFIICIEFFVYMKISFVSRSSFANPYILYEGKYNLCEKLNNDFNYRIAGDVLSLNENLICKKAKIGEFNTMNTKFKSTFFENSGFSVSSSIIYTYFTYPPFIYSLLGTKYIYTDDITEPILYGYHYLYDFKIDKQKFYVYENDNVVPIGFAFSENDYNISSNYNPFSYQNSFAKYLTNTTVFDSIDYEVIDEKSFKVKITNDFPIYLNYMDCYDIDFSIDDEKINTYKEKKASIDMKEGILYIENKYAGKEVTFRFKEKISYDKMFLYYLNEQKYKKVISILNENPVDVISMNENKLVGNIKLDKKKTILFTIPYSGNFKILVDEKKVNISKKYDTFLGFDIGKGEHKIEIVYEHKNFILGIFISIFSLLFVFLLKYKKFL